MFTNPPNKSLDPHSVKRAKNIISDDVTISSADEEGWSIIYDQRPTKVGVKGSAWKAYDLLPVKIQGTDFCQF